MADQMNAAQANSMARDICVRGGLSMLQPIPQGTSTFVPSTTPQFSFTVPAVGLARGIWVQVTATILNASAAQAMTVADFGAANVLSKIQLIDLMSYERINVPGWQLALLNTVKGQRPMGDSLVRTTGINSPNNYGANWTVNSATASVAAGGANNATVNQWYYIPISYSETDLRGAIFAATTSASIRVTLTPNASPVVASTSDATQACYQSAGALTTGSVITSMTVNTWYDYIDQIPVGRDGKPILPMLDLSTMYELKSTLASNAVTASQDNQIQIPNMRSFLSFALCYVSAAAGTRASGSDINYISRRTANITDIFKISPQLSALQTRQTIGCDLPPGWYYLPSRKAPVSTSQYGNQSIIVNPITAAAGAYILFGWEAMAPLATIPAAASLTAAG